MSLLSGGRLGRLKSGGFSNLIVVCCLLSVTGCGVSSSSGDGAPETDARETDDPSGSGPWYLSDVRPIFTSDVDQLQHLEVENIPVDGSVTDIHAEYRLAESDKPIGRAEGAAILPMFEYDGADMVAMPLVGKSGTTLRLRFTDGDHYGPEFKIQLNPLPQPKEGSLNALIGELERLVETVAEKLQLAYPGELEQMLANPEEVPPYMVPLLRMYDMVVRSDNPKSLVNRSYTQEQRELTERILALIAPKSSLRRIESFIASDKSMLDEFGEVRTEIELNSLRRSGSTFYAIPDAKKLSSYMELARTARKRRDQLKNDRSSRKMSIAALTAWLKSKAKGGWRNNSGANH